MNDKPETSIVSKQCLNLYQNELQGLINEEANTVDEQQMIKLAKEIIQSDELRSGIDCYVDGVTTTFLVLCIVLSIAEHEKTIGRMYRILIESIDQTASCIDCKEADVLRIAVKKNKDTNRVRQCVTEIQRAVPPVNLVAVYEISEHANACVAEYSEGSLSKVIGTYSEILNSFSESVQCNARVLTRRALESAIIRELAETVNSDA